MTHVKFAVAETPLGAFAIAWSDAGIVQTWMHAGTIDRAREQAVRAHPFAAEAPPPPSIERAMAAVAALQRGEAVQLPGELDMTGIPEFDQRVYEIARTIGAGSTMTYGEIAKALGEEPMRARDVGIALARNRFAPIVPCHRVVAAGGKLGGYSAPGGVASKRRLLEIEGAVVAVKQPEPLQLDLFTLAARDT